MKTWIWAASSLALAITWSAAGRAATYYVSPTGNDGAVGSDSAPFKTIAHAASVMVAGDVCRVHAGTYREQIVVARSGTANNPIVFEAVAGERPVVSGTDPVVGTWGTEPDGARSIGGVAPVRQLFAGKMLLVEARWPNVTGDVLTHWTTGTATAGTTTTLTATTLPAGDWTNALVHIVAGSAWTAYTRHVASYDAATKTITFDRPINELTDLVPQAGDAFYVFASRLALDAPGEWFFDSVASKLFLIPPAGTEPASMDVETKTRDYAFDLNGRDYVVVRGFDVFGASIRAENSHGVIIDGCDLEYPSVLRELDGYKSGNPAPRLSGSGNQWINGKIEHAPTDGLIATGDHQQIIDNEITDVAYSAGNFAGIETSGTSHTIRNNTIRSSGRFGILFGNTAQSSITYNRVDETCLLTLDCGLLYAWNTDGQGGIIAYNDLSNNHTYLGFGIYIDDSSRNFVIHHNLVHGVSFGAIHIKAANDLYNNTLSPEPNKGEPGEAIVVSESLNNRGPVDLSHSKIINNLLRADASVHVRLAEPSITDYAYYETSVPVRGDWSNVKLAFSDFKQATWGKAAPFTQNALDQVLFDVAGQGHYEIGIDNMRRLPSGALVDDLEDGNSVNPAGGNWIASAGTGSSATLAIQGPGAGASRFAATATGDNVAGGWSQLQMQFAAGDRAVDFTTDSGLSFDCRATITHTYGTPPTIAITGANADCPVDANYLPTTSCAIDKGQVVAGITDGFVGSGPDIGAFEVGAAAWKAGAHASQSVEADAAAASGGAGPGSTPPKQQNPNCACDTARSFGMPPWSSGLAMLMLVGSLRRRRSASTVRATPWALRCPWFCVWSAATLRSKHLRDGSRTV